MLCRTCTLGRKRASATSTSARRLTERWFDADRYAGGDAFVRRPRFRLLRKMHSTLAFLPADQVGQGFEMREEEFSEDKAGNPESFEINRAGNRAGSVANRAGNVPTVANRAGTVLRCQPLKSARCQPCWKRASRGKQEGQRVSAGSVEGIQRTRPGRDEDQQRRRRLPQHHVVCVGPRSPLLLAEVCRRH